MCSDRRTLAAAANCERKRDRRYLPDTCRGQDIFRDIFWRDEIFFVDCSPTRDSDGKHNTEARVDTAASSMYISTFETET